MAILYERNSNLLTLPYQLNSILNINENPKECPYNSIWLNELLVHLYMIAYSIRIQNGMALEQNKMTKHILHES